MSGTDEWLQPIVEIRGTTFEIRKLLPIPSYRLFNKMMNESAKAFENIDFGSGHQGNVFLAGMKIMMQLPAELWEQSSQVLFTRVFFTNANHPKSTPLAGNEEAAFDGLLGIHVHEVVVRAFLGTYAEWSDELRSRLPEQVKTILSEFAQRTSTPSSPIPSMPVSED